MKVTPHINADFEDYPELARLYDAAIRRVVELMQIHDIAEMRRIRKTGVFNHPYEKDSVAPIGVASAPSTVAAVRYAVAGALLDYLGAIGVSGITLEVSDDEKRGLAGLWAANPPNAEQGDGKPGHDLEPQQEQAAQPDIPVETAADNHVETPTDKASDEENNKE